MCVCAVQDGKTPMESLHSWQNGAKSLLGDFSQEGPAHCHQLTAGGER